LQKCTLVNNVASSVGGAAVVTAGQLEWINCLIKNNEAGNSGGALFLQSVQVKITATVFLANLGGLDAGAIASHEATLSLRNCTFHVNDSDSEATVLSSHQSHTVLTDCLITGSGSSLLAGLAQDYAITRTNILPLTSQAWPALIADVANTAGNLAVDPLYCAPESGDLHLREGSPCLSATTENQIGALAQGCGAQFP